MNIKKNVVCQFVFENSNNNRKKLFEKALFNAKLGKVLYILLEELTELPQLSQDLNFVDRQYMKMISFLYVNTFDLLIENISSLPGWKNVPTTIILDGIGEYCNKNNLQGACGIVALLLDTVYNCSFQLKSTCHLYISADKDVVGEEYCNVLQDLYSTDL